MARRSYQRGYVSKCFAASDGTFGVVIRYRNPVPNNQPMHPSETLRGFASRKEARTKGYEVIQQRIAERTNRTPAAGDMTVQQFTETFWEPYLARKAVKPSTQKSYDCVLKNVVLPSIGQLRMVDVSPLAIEQLMKKRLESGVKSKTVRNDLAVVQGIFSLAMDNDLVSRNPVRKRHKPQLVRMEKPTWNAQQVLHIISAVPEEFQALFICVSLTGLRLGELLGLQWKHIDFEKQILTIKQALWNGQLLPPKTAGSVRSIPFGPALRMALRRHWNGSTHRRPEDFVFSKKDGRPLSGDVLRRDVLYPTLDRLGFSLEKRAAGFHAFRHSAASFINAETGNLKLAQKLLGHSNLTMTAEVYTHTTAEAERAAALAVERAIYGDLFQSCSQITNTNNCAVPN